MAGLGRRLVNWLIGEDEAANALAGGRVRETISGTVGRAAARGDWWAVHIGQPVVNALMRDPQHCQKVAANEAARRAALGEN